MAAARRHVCGQLRGGAGRSGHEAPLQGIELRERCGVAVQRRKVLAPPQQPQVHRPQLAVQLVLHQPVQLLGFVGFSSHMCTNQYMSRVCHSSGPGSWHADELSRQVRSQGQQQSYQSSL